MALKKVSALSQATAVDAADTLYLVQGGVSKRVLAGLFVIAANAAQTLGLKMGAFRDVGTAAGTLAAGDHNHDSRYTLAGVSNAPVGLIVLMPRLTPPNQYIKANGAVLSRTAYPKLWAEAQASEALVSEAEWAAGRYGCYSTGNGSTTFRIPDVRAYALRALDDGRGIDSGRLLGSAQNDAIQNITGSFTIDDHMGDNLEGAFRKISNTWYDASSGGGGGGILLGFDASLVVRTAEETRMKNIALMAFIKYT